MRSGRTQEVGDGQEGDRLLDAGRQEQLTEAERTDNGAQLACTRMTRKPGSSSLPLLRWKLALIKRTQHQHRQHDHNSVT